MCTRFGSTEAGARERVVEEIKKEEVNNRAAGHMEKVGKADKVGAIISSTRSTR